MTLKEFQAKIDRAEDKLIQKTIRRDDVCWGICEVLDRHLEVHFQELFCPQKYSFITWGHKFFWKGGLLYLPVRIIALRLFEQIVIDSGEYRQW